MNGFGFSYIVKFCTFRYVSVQRSPRIMPLLFPHTLSHLNLPARLNADGRSRSDPECRDGPPPLPDEGFNRVLVQLMDLSTKVRAR